MSHGPRGFLSAGLSARGSGQLEGTGEVPGVRVCVRDTGGLKRILRGLRAPRLREAARAAGRWRPRHGLLVPVSPPRGRSLCGKESEDCRSFSVVR